MPTPKPKSADRLANLQILNQILQLLAPIEHDRNSVKLILQTLAVSHDLTLPKDL